MKALLAAIAFLAVISLRSEAAPAGDTLENQFIRQTMEQPPPQDLLGLQPEKPNEIRAGGLTYSGILVELTRTDDSLELINPMASAEYGSPEDNLARDPITGRISGLKLFSISW
ncbi:MAG TPA: hypothetical protein VG938_18740 [Verrucomicrobiae bacterium]|jgi:hypothetical protein|nr:hypothetical protein [Verrucomicrobiae bacterium]